MREWFDDNGSRHWVDDNGREHVEVDAVQTVSLDVRLEPTEQEN